MKYFHLGSAPNFRRQSSRFDSGAPSVRFAFSYGDISRPYRCCNGPSNSHRLPFMVFLPPSTVCATTDLASLFHPAAVSRIHSSRDFPPTQPRRLIDAALPSCRFSQPELPAVSRELRPASSRLQGFAPCKSPLSKRRGLAAALPAPFLSFSSSRFCSLF